GGDVNRHETDSQNRSGAIPHRVDAHEMVPRPVARGKRVAQLTVDERLGCLENPGYQRPDSCREATAGLRERVPEKRLDRCAECGGEGIVELDPVELAVNKAEAVWRRAQ